MGGLQVETVPTSHDAPGSVAVRVDDGVSRLAVITDLGIMTPDPVTKELTLTSVHPGVTVEKVVAETGWKLKVAPAVTTTAAPTEQELSVLRDLQERTARAHA